MNTVTINNKQLPEVEYRGQRVVTLKMIDEVHQRPEGTARKRF
ncbi:ORF6N domain-containing protein, partial [Salmonella enterica]